MDAGGGGDPSEERRVVSATLEETISSRKAEWKEETEIKLKSDLELIRKRNSQQEGGKNPFEILPKAIWGVVLEKVDGAENIRNARDVCTLFRELLEEKYFSQVLFPEVLCLKTFRKFNGNRFSAVTFEPTLGLDQVSKWRQVSKQWRDGVDFYIEQGIRNLEWVQDGNTWRKIRIPRMMVASGKEDRELIEKMTNLFEESQKKCGSGKKKRPEMKLVARSVDLSVLRKSSPDAVRSLICTTIPKFIEATGNQILRFQVIFCIVDMKRAKISWSWMYRRLKRWMDDMPNLVWLDVQICCSSCSAYELKKLREHIRKNPFPRLAYLKKLAMKHGFPHNEAEVCIFTAILEANPHLTELDFAGVPRIEDVGDGDAVTLPIHSLGMIDSLTLDWVKLYPGLLRTSWPLKKLDLKLCNYKTPTNLRELFGMLENFETIQWLKIELKNVLCQNPGFLRLPNVTCFSYSFREIYNEEGKRKKKGKGEREGMYGIDFIVFLKKLEIFHWTCRAYNPPESLKEGEIGSEIIQFGRGEMNMSYSNIWDVLPALRKIKVSTLYAHMHPETPHLDHMYLTTRTFGRESKKSGVDLSSVPRKELYYDTFVMTTLTMFDRYYPSSSECGSDDSDSEGNNDGVSGGGAGGLFTGGGAGGLFAGGGAGGLFAGGGAGGLFTGGGAGGMFPGGLFAGGNAGGMFPGGLITGGNVGGGLDLGKAEDDGDSGSGSDGGDFLGDFVGSDAEAD